MVSEDVQGLATLWAGTSHGALVQQGQTQMLAQKQTKLVRPDVQAQGGVWDAREPGAGVWIPLPEEADAISATHAVQQPIGSGGVEEVHPGLLLEPTVLLQGAFLWEGAIQGPLCPDPTGGADGVLEARQGFP